MPFESRRLRVQLQCHSGSQVGMHVLPKTIRPWCFQVRSCPYGSCGHPSPVARCPSFSEPCFWSPVIDTPLTPQVLPQDPIPIEVDPEDPDVVLLRPEHLPRLRGQLQMELAQIDELALRKGEIESQLKELDSVEKELKKRAGER